MEHKEFSSKWRNWSSKNRKFLLKLAVIFVIIILSFGLNIHQNRNDTINLKENTKTEASAESDAKKPDTKTYYVDISGEVHNPGVYKVNSTTRLYELVNKAGGLTEDADRDAINQASYLEDGSKIIIPKVGETTSGTSAAVSGDSSSNSGVSEKVNINTADKEELMTLPGVGEVIADRIIEYRAGSRFASAEDIKNVSGIGEATFEKMKSKITV